MHPADERLRQIDWRDLVLLNRWERCWEVVLPAPWLVLSLTAYAAGWWPLGMLGSFFFFLTGLRLSHNSQHHALGLGRTVHDLVLATLSCLMLASMHAVRVTHLQHHKHCLREEDVEAGHAQYPWWRAILYGPLFLVRMHHSAWKLGSRHSCSWIALEMGMVACVLVVSPWSSVLQWHVLAMLSGECLTAFFAVWIVHHGCDAEKHIARTQRGWLKNFLSYSMLYHLEHHLYPAVPTCHLQQLARRLDQVIPEAREKQVI